jgi:hypothetical protein
MVRLSGGGGGGHFQNQFYSSYLVFFSVQCHSECVNHVSIWKRCIQEAETNEETKEALAKSRREVVCYIIHFSEALSIY